MKFSDYLAAFAVLISTLSLYLSWRQYARDRSRLKLSIKVVDDFHSGPMFVISAVNVGRRPITIGHGYALVSSGKRYPVYETPVLLEETKGFEFSVPFMGFFKSLSSGTFITAFEIEDTSGKRTRIKTGHLKAQIKKYLSPLIP